MNKSYKVPNEADRMNVVDYMTGILGYSTSKSKRLLKDKKVKINGKVGYWDKRLKGGDIIEIDILETSGQNIIPENIPISVIYEDNYLLAVNKPPFMLVHPTPNHPDNTLLNAAAYYFSKKGEDIGLRLLNRLDMNTSGIVIIPKSSWMHNRLGEMMRGREITKVYKAVVEGIITPREGIIDQPIGKDTENSIKRKVVPGGQEAITIYETIEELKGYSVVKLNLVTRRTHQIRVHLSHLGHPIVGDTLYGKKSDFIERQALHASDMEFVHPMEGHLLKLHAELTDDISELIHKLKQE